MFISKLKCFIFNQTHVYTLYYLYSDIDHTYDKQCVNIVKQLALRLIVTVRRIPTEIVFDLGY